MKNQFKILIGLLVVALIVWFLVLNQRPGRILEMDFLNVGQGDAILIKTPKGQTVLIDGGPDNKVLEKLGKYLQPLQKRIDLIILTHPHADHVTGLIEVLRRYSVGLVILNGVYLKTDNYDQFLKAIEDNKVKVLIAEAGEAIHFDKDLEFDILYPNENPAGLVFNKNSESFGTVGNDVNDTSIVGKLIFNDFSIMFVGDVTSKVENQLLLAYGNGLKSDILKVSHHGSKYSSFPFFLKAVAPKAGIIEVGAKNFYNLPSPAALSRFAMLDINIFRTGQNGDIRVLSNGFTTNIYKEK
ncbi:MAG: MBL fold metallo-hydrolase [Candidatus Azambacteria bacterium]|nr:MBL fold metallo-hydrolase [Candidatus Azambacteria bacterium]